MARVSSCRRVMSTMVSPSVVRVPSVFSVAVNEGPMVLPTLAELGFLEKLTFLQAGGLGKYNSKALLVNFTPCLLY
ncbi:hypothetical protein E2562_022794 [Oryza meyeriana var. granulata]|uniref:Uncharacterized protein n=1 Tax=Oryza meyeriana var. granulata TaxID=110450 RepID=A0A6G1EY76_9ORYZ|nr:hypothetical protein E2562_022794 [Oryza meyeriana var. granulata]